jgi:hypothetical protein
MKKLMIEKNEIQANGPLTVREFPNPNKSLLFACVLLGLSPLGNLLG